MVPIWMTSWPAAPSVNPRVYETWRITPALRPLAQDVVGDVANALWVLMGTIGIVMLVACANVASLLLVAEPRGGNRNWRCGPRSARAGDGSLAELLVESALLDAVVAWWAWRSRATGLGVLVNAGPARCRA